MAIMRTVTNADGSFVWTEGLVHESDFDRHDMVRTGFRKGTLKKATFELNSGNIITYELVEDDNADS